MAVNPKTERLILQRYDEVRHDELQTVACEIVGKEFSVSSPTVARIVKRRHAPIEQLTSSDFEIRAIPIREPPRPQTNDLLDSNGRYELTREERWLILPDTQVPYHDQRTLDAVLQYAAANRWDGCIQLGDYMDWDFCSRWSADNARKAEGQRFLQEYITGNDVLDQIQDAVRKQNPDCHLIVIEGNHDWRIQNVIDKTPALAGMIDVEKNLRFDERNALYWRYWVHRKPIIIGKAHFIHGDYIGTHHAKKTADSYHRNVFYGHTHTLQAYTKTTLAEDSVQCWSLGTLSKFDLEYMGKRPSSWMQCFAEFYFREDGSFNHYVTNIIEHAFTAIDGKHYTG
jgi:hypothetical protein